MKEEQQNTNPKLQAATFILVALACLLMVCGMIVQAYYPPKSEQVDELKAKVAALELGMNSVAEWAKVVNNNDLLHIDGLNDVLGRVDNNTKQMAVMFDTLKVRNLRIQALEDGRAVVPAIVEGVVE